MEEKVYINGRYLKASAVRVSVFDRGFTYGDGLFETIKAYRGRPFLLKLHLERMRLGAKALGIPTGVTASLTAKGGGPVVKLLKTNGLECGEAVIKIVLTRGAGPRGHGRVKKPKPTLIVTASSAKSEAIERLKRRGVRAAVAKGRAVVVPGVKTLNYLPSVLAKQEAERKRLFEALFIDPDGSLLEGTATNLFIVKKGRILTPAADGRILPGITRWVVLGLAKEDGIPAKEVRLSVGDLTRADEAFLTNSVLEIVPLVRLDGDHIGEGRPGPVTRRIQALYHEATIRG